jgi:hypothetical protein
MVTCSRGPRFISGSPWFENAVSAQIVYYRCLESVASETRDLVSDINQICSVERGRNGVCRIAATPVFACCRSFRYPPEETARLASYSWCGGAAVPAVIYGRQQPWAKEV